MQSKRLSAAESLDSLAVFDIGFSVRWHGFCVICVIQATPLLLFLVPPNQFLALAPRLAIWTRRSPVVNNAAIVRPCKTPSVPQQVFRFAFIGAVITFFGEYATVNPGTTRG